MKPSVVLVAFAVVAAACGGNSDSELETVAESTDERATSRAADASTVLDASEPEGSTTMRDSDRLTPGADCDPDLDEFVDAQFAFVGTVIDVRGEVLLWDVNPENPDRPDDPQPTRWVTFDVAGWYTVDWGTEFRVWMPVHDAVVGDRLAVGGDARRVSIDGFSGQSGEVEFCTPASEPTAESLGAWDAFFGPPIEAGAAVPEGDPDPEYLAAIDEAEAAWNAAAGDSYSYVFSMHDRNDPSTCGSRPQRVVVTAGGTESTSLDAPRSTCEQAEGNLPTVAELFALARQVAGATDFDFRSNIDNGIVMSFYASDRSVEVQVNVRRYSPSTAPTIVGWDAVRDAAEVAQATWSSAGGDRTTRIQSGGGERTRNDLTTIEVDGTVTEVRNGAELIDGASLEQPWNPYTVDGIFTLIDELDGQGHVVAVFDPDIGAPTDLYFDPVPNAIDDELRLQISVTNTRDTDTSRVVSAAEQALIDAGADVTEFPGDLSDPRLTNLCGVEMITFDSDISSLDSVVECLSTQAESGTGAAAVFTTYTVEGDPVVSLWLVAADRASVFTDISQDAYGGGPFAWIQLDCHADLPLPTPVSEFPDPYMTFQC